MKRSLFFLLSALCCFCVGDASAEECSPQVDHIVTNGQGVCLQIGDHLIVADGLLASGEGILVLVSGEWITIDAALEFSEYNCVWKCQKCGYINMDQINRCPICGKAR